MSVTELAIKLILLISVGYISRKLKVMPDGFDKQLTKFVTSVPLPCMIVNSFQIEFSREDLLNCPVLLGLSLLSMAVLFAFAQLIYIRMKRTGIAKSVRFGLLFTNFTFFGLPVVSELYGQQGVFYYVIFTLPIRIFFYGLAPITLGRSGARMTGREFAKKFFCPPVVAVFIGLLIYVLQIPLPNVVSNTLSSLGAMASPLGLLLCGSIIADADLRGVSRYPFVIWTSLARLIAIPALITGLFLLLGVDHALIRTCVYYFAMPVASLLPTFCLQYNPDDVEARTVGGFMVVASTILCVITVPAWAIVLNLLA